MLPRAGGNRSSRSTSVVKKRRARAAAGRSRAGESRPEESRQEYLASSADLVPARDLGGSEYESSAQMAKARRGGRRAKPGEKKSRNRTRRESETTDARPTLAPPRRLAAQGERQAVRWPRDKSVVGCHLSSLLL